MDLRAQRWRSVPSEACPAMQRPSPSAWPDGSLSRPGFSATTSDDSAVLRVGPQIFYLDPRTDAEFAEGDDGIVTGIVIKAGGMLLLSGPRAGKGVSVATPNASGAIHGTTMYIISPGRKAKPEPISAVAMVLLKYQIWREADSCWIRAITMP